MQAEDWMTARRPLTVAQLNQIASRMQGRGGVTVRNRRYRFRRYENCFVGREAVDWMMTEFVLSRAQAIRLGERLHAHRLIRHVLDEHDFADDRLFYRFAGERTIDHSEALKNAVIKDIDLRQLVQRMRDRGGVRTGTQHHWFVRYPNCFEGREAVTWLALDQGLARDEAVALGKRLLRRDFVRHVFDEHDFEDRRYFYRFI